MEIIKKLKENLIRIENKKVSKVIAGGANGSIIIIDFEDTYSLFVFCAWRFISKDVIVTWNDSPDALKGEIPIYLKSLVNKKLKKIILINDYDLKLEFDNGVVFSVFSDLNSTSSDIEENWCVIDIVENKSYNLTNEFEYSLTKFDESR